MKLKVAEETGFHRRPFTWWLGKARLQTTKVKADREQVVLRIQKTLIQL